MFNHSCAPNAVVVFPEGCGEEGGMKVVLIEDVVPGQEVSLFRTGGLGVVLTTRW